MAKLLSCLLFVLVGFVVLTISLGLFRSIMVVAFYNAVPLAAGAALALLAPLCIVGGRSLLGNIFLVHNGGQLAWLTGLSLIAGTLVVAEHRTVISNADRFEGLSTALEELGDYNAGLSRTATSYPWAACLELLMALPTPLMAYWFSVKSGEGVGRQGLIGGLFLGVIIYGVFALLVTLIEQRIVWRESHLSLVFPTDWFFEAAQQPAPDLKGSPNADAWLPNLTGYFVPKKWLPRPGHLQLAIATIVMALIYGLLITSVTKFRVALSHQDALPASFFVVFLVALGSLVFSGLAFFFDFYHVPITLVSFVYILVIYNVLGATGALGRFRMNREHIFEVPTKHDPTRNNSRLRISEIANGRNGLKTAVIVTAPGGGIHAAAWTARVLTGLHERYEDFSPGLLGISATSGGSVGAMFFLEQFAHLATEADAAEMETVSAVFNINDRAQASCLEAVAWGLGGPDLLRILSPIGTPDWDRGRAMEQRWENLIGVKRNETPLRLSAWEAQVKDGKMPAVAFNATEVETGRRVVFSTARIAIDGDVPSECKPIDFLTQYADKDIDVATAVRLSASFPYVSPAAIPEKPGLKGLWHVVDGGYVDNEGIVTAIGWAEEIVDQSPEIENVILIRIRHGSPKPNQNQGATFLNSPFFNAMFAPENAMMQVRITSQQERGQMEARLVKKNVPRMTTATLEFTLTDSDWRNEWLRPPLSWKLSKKQRTVYDTAWRRLTADNGFEQLDKLFRRRS